MVNNLVSENFKLCQIKTLYCVLENHVLWAGSEFFGYAWKYKQGVLEYWKTVEDPAASGGVLD